MEVSVEKQIAKLSKRPFPSCLLPEYESESSCETIHMEMSVFGLQVHFNAKLTFSYERFCTWICFETICE